MRGRAAPTARLGARAKTRWKGRASPFAARCAVGIERSRWVNIGRRRGTLVLPTAGTPARAEKCVGCALTRATRGLSRGGGERRSTSEKIIPFARQRRGPRVPRFGALTCSRDNETIDCIVARLRRRLADARSCLGHRDVGDRRSDGRGAQHPSCSGAGGGGSNGRTDLSPQFERSFRERRLEERTPETPTPERGAHGTWRERRQRVAGGRIEGCAAWARVRGNIRRRQ